MTTQTAVDLVRYQDAIELRYAASVDLYESELALHAARQSGVDEWVRAAGEHLHRAVMALAAADADFAAELRIRNGAQAPERQDPTLRPMADRSRDTD
jgi:hypothetical protein